MTTRAMGPFAGFGWLSRGMSVAFNHPKPVFGGAAVLLVLCLLPTLVTMPLQLHSLQGGTPPSPATFGGIMVVAVLFGLLIVPVYAGFLRVIDAAARGRPAHALDVFQPYRQGEALRLIGYGLVVVFSYIVILGIVMAVAGSGIVHWYMQVMTAQATHQPPPALPHGFWTVAALLTLLWLFMIGFYAISLGQVALGRRSVLNAIGDGLLGALKNLLPLIGFVLAFVITWIVLLIVIGIAFLICALLARFIGAWLMFVLVVPLYFAMMLFVFAIMFGAMYHLWRDVCDDGTAPDAAHVIAA
jgi:hypothetical protein